MTKLTKEQTIKVVETIRDANESLKGTPDYYKYWMSNYCLSSSISRSTGKEYSHWHFVGNYVPSYVHQNDDVIIYKKIRDVEWLYYGDERYALTDEVKKLFN